MCITCCFFRMMIVYFAFLMPYFRSCSLTRPLVDWKKGADPVSTGSVEEKEQETNRPRLSNRSIFPTENDINIDPRKEALTIEEQVADDRANETRPIQSARWDQYHRFPQTIESVPRAIHHIVETSKKLLDPFSISKLIMESIPDAVKEFAWYLVLALATVWAILIITVVLYVTIKFTKFGCCMMKNSFKGIKATSNLMKTSCAGRRRQKNIVHDHVHDDV